MQWDRHWDAVASRLRTMLGSRRAILVFGIVAVALALPALQVGLEADDYFLVISLVDSSTFPQLASPPWDIFGFLNEEEATNGREVLKHGEFWRSMPVMPGAQDGFEKVRSQAKEMFLVTSPWPPCEVWESVRKAWAGEHFQVDQKHVIPASTKYPVSGK